MQHIAVWKTDTRNVQNTAHVINDVVDLGTYLFAETLCGRRFLDKTSRDSEPQDPRCVVCTTRNRKQKP